MSRRRFLGVLFGGVGAVLLALLLYVAFGDLGRHKTRIEAFVSKSIGRTFTIEGPLKVRLIPVIDVSAESVRLGNVEGGSQPQMVEIGRAAVRIGFWSLISGPPDVRSFELRDATVLMERGPDGQGNWIMGAPESEPADDEDYDADAVEVPLVIRSAQLHNVRLIYREAGKSDRVAQLDTLGITPGQDELLALDGHGKLDVYPMSLKGEAGPLKSLLAARDMRMALQLTLGKLAIDIKGIVGRLDPLDGADVALKIQQPEMGDMLRKLEFPVLVRGALQIEGHLKDIGKLTQLDFNAAAGQLKASMSGTLATLSLVGADLGLTVEQPDVGPMLEALKLPGFATGAMRIETRIKDVGKHRQLDFDAVLGDIKARVNGTLRTRSLIGSDLRFEASAGDAARLARAFDIEGVPAAPLTLSGHTVRTRKELKFDSLTATLADASVRADGSAQSKGGRKIALNFELKAASLAALREKWPPMAVAATGSLESAKDRVELKDVKAKVGETEFTGAFLLVGGKQIEAQLSSPRVDLTPFLPKEEPAPAAAMKTKTSPEAPKKKFLFSETPLPIEKMRDVQVKVHLALGELVLADRSLKNVDSKLQAEQGRLTFDLRATGAHEGTLQSAGTLVPAADGTADLTMELKLTDMRTNLGSEGIAPQDAPPVSVAMNISIHGNSPRQMAAGANGQLLLTQSAGKTRSGFIGTFGGDFVQQLAHKLNPFAKDDPFMKLDCTIARADIVNGKVTVKPILMQSEKVTVTAHGTVDLHTEKLLLDFNTRPRKGIGVSPGMFTNPLIRLEGTLMEPKMGFGAKGVASGWAAAASGGLTVVAGGLVDRMAGEADLCAKTLVEAGKPVATDSTKDIKVSKQND